PPALIGHLRLMAVAYARSRAGSADQRLYVRDAVSADVVLPRFLAPNDRGRLALSLHNIDGQAGDYRLVVQATGSVSLDRPGAGTRRRAGAHGRGVRCGSPGGSQRRGGWPPASVSS